MDHIRFYFSLFRRRAHWFALCVVLCTAAGLGAAIMAPPVFVATAKLVVESEKIPDELAASTVQTQALEHLHIIEQRVLARETLIDMAGRMGLYAGSGMATDEILTDLRSRIAVEITGDSNARIRTEATLLQLAVEAGTPAQSAAIANELVTLVLAEDVSMRTSVARQTLDFFNQEVSRLEQDLSGRSQAILTFREENRSALPDSLEFRRTRLGLLHEQLTALDDRQDDIDRRRARQVRLHESIHGVAETRTTRPASDRAVERRRLRNLIAQREALPNGDPAIEDFERRIESLRKLIGLEETVVRSSAYERRLQDYDEELATLEDRRSSLLSEITEIERSMAATSGLAVQLAALERDQANLQLQYDDAIAARALAETGDAIESLSKGQRVTVIEQAVPPRSPARPNRSRIAIMGLVAGLVLGTMAIVGLIAMTGNLRRPKDLVAGLGIAPFGTLPYIRTEAEIRATHRRAALTAGGAVALIALGLGAIHTLLVPLDLLAASTLRDGPMAIPELIRDAKLTKG